MLVIGITRIVEAAGIFAERKHFGRQITWNVKTFYVPWNTGRSGPWTR